ncbi:HNH endonuclease [Reichenbachiella agarivorans]|uniref:HNH endonuclease n=1 Tax=Reichenbachiella agarivorans TaxID=2979464 RepID=A0ABY6CX96_9BACT|nr:HNH endonuclease [Reichenbachiella agarivorans]UXP34073.1 HNH endonuclease [Reichenbachiella agarivorans]
MDEVLSKYLIKFKKLRVDRSHGIAPHKPILLISIIQSYQGGQITDNRIYITPELVALFKSNWSELVITNHDCRMSYPFFYMKSEGFWRLVPRSGFSDLKKMGSLVKSFSSLNSAVEYAEIEPDLYALLIDHQSSQILLHFLLDEYFPDTKGKISGGTSGADQLLTDAKDNIVNEPPGEYRTATRRLIDQKADEEIFLRGSLFKREIPRIYGNRCWISGMKIDTAYNISMIDACHIVPFSESYDDTVSNGIALCPNLHRAFDKGLISINPDYVVCVSDGFIEEDSYSIRQYSGHKIVLPNQASYWPSRENLEWHGVNVFKQ